MISFDDFAKIELEVGTILEASEIKGSDKLIKLKVALGEKNPRQILAGLKKWYRLKDLVGKQVVVVTNLEPKRMMGTESQGMLLAVSGDEKPILLRPSSKVSNGAKVQ